MSDTEGRPTAYVQWQGTRACMDVHCPECGTHGHFHPEYQLSIICVGCGMRYGLSRVQLVAESRSFDECSALPDRRDLQEVCERMEEAGGLSEAEEQAVSYVLDCDIAPPPTEAARAIVEWAARNYEG